MTNGTRMAVVAVTALLVACGQDQPGDQPAPGAGAAPTAGEPESEPTPSEEPIAPGDTLASELQLRATQFAEGMTPATPLFRGTLATGETQDYQAVLQGSRCFKVIGVGGEGVTDLDLFLFDPDGAQMLQDTATDSYPVLGLTHPICPQTSGAYRVQVKMFEGSGEFGVRVYQTDMQ